MLENIKLGNMRTMGSRGAHVKWPAQKERASFDVIGFGFAEKLKKAGQNFNEANLLGYLESNTWQGNTKLQLRLLDIAPTAQPFEII